MANFTQGWSLAMRTLILLTLSVVPTVAGAADWGAPSDALEKALPRDCDASSDAGLYDCAAKAFEKADAQLNEVWKKVLANVDSRSSDLGLTAAQSSQWKDDLVEAQRAWNTFKDKDCNGARRFEYSGSGSSLAALSCQFEYTTARTSDLDARYLSQ
jgi:uncharacterized protein YecT (DUF1311 family)